MAGELACVLEAEEVEEVGEMPKAGEDAVERWDKDQLHLKQITHSVPGLGINRIGEAADHLSPERPFGRRL